MASINKILFKNGDELYSASLSSDAPIFDASNIVFQNRINVLEEKNTFNDEVSFNSIVDFSESATFNKNISLVLDPTDDLHGVNKKYVDNQLSVRASTTSYGTTKLNSAINSDSEELAASSKAVKTAYDLANTANQTANTAKTTANNALPKAGGTISGNLTVSGNCTLSDATCSTAQVNDRTTKVANTSYVRNAIEAHLSSLPAGTLVSYSGTTIPSGFLLCNGQSFNKNTYPNLFSAIGYKYGGSGDNANVPNINNRTLWATTNTANVGKTLEAGLPNISGSISPVAGKQKVRPTTSGAFTSSDSGDSGAWDNNIFFGTSTINLSAQRSSSIYGANSSVQPAASQVLIIIKV